MIKKIYLNQNLISQEINNKTHILTNKQKDCVVWDKNGLGLSSYKNYFCLEIDENKNYVVHSNINNKNGNIVGKNLILSFEKLKQENKKQFNLQNKNYDNNDLLNEYNNHYENTKIQQRKLTATELKQLLEDLENIDNPNHWDNGIYLGYNKYEKKLSLLSIFSLSCGSTMPLLSCGNIANNKPHLAPTKPKKPIIKDIFYYEKLKQEITAEIKEYDEVIKEIKNSKNDYESEEDYQTELKQTQAEQFIKISEINDYEYQILLCQKENEFTNEQKQQAIKLLEKQINNLNSALNLLSEIKNSDFDQKDLEKIKTKIKNTKIILDEIKNN